MKREVAADGQEVDEGAFVPKLLFTKLNLFADNS